MEFVENHADARIKMTEAGITWNIDRMDTELKISKFWLGNKLVGVYDEKLSMVFYEVTE